MKLTETNKKIIAQREERISIHKKSLVRYLENVQSLQEEIKIEEQDLIDFKNTIDSPITIQEST